MLGCHAVLCFILCTLYRLINGGVPSGKAPPSLSSLYYYYCYYYYCYYYYCYYYYHHNYYYYLSFFRNVFKAQEEEEIEEVFVLL